MRFKLNEIISDVFNICDSIASSVNAQSYTASDIAKDASRQASSIEEVSATLEELAANIQSNNRQCSPIRN
jgi:methyl-accepting chemotaxis protein